MNAATEIDVQYACSATGLPSVALVRKWASAALETQGREGGEVAIRLVDAAEGAQLNETYRGKAGPTNVLAFPAGALDAMPADHLGDLAICVPVVVREAAEQNKALEAHFAHMVVHGTLHLLGQDHQNEVEAEAMEALEIAILRRLGYPNPYET